MYLQTEESLCVYFSPPSTLLKDSCKKKFGFICEKEVINSRIKRQINFKNDEDDELNRAIDEAKRNLDLTRKPENLENVYKALLTIKPTSVESERAFSAMGLFCTKLRNRLNDDTLNSLVMMRQYYLAQKKA